MEPNETTETDTESEIKSAESPFVTLLKDETRLRTLNLFLENDGFYLTEEIICEEIDAPNTEVLKQIRILEDMEFIEWGDSEQSYGYRLNDEHELSDALFKFQTKMYRYTTYLNERDDV